MMVSGIRQLAAGSLWFMLAAALLVVSCSRSEDPLVSQELAGRCVVVRAAENETDATHWSAWLSRHLRSSSVHSWSAMDNAVTEALAGDRLLVVAAYGEPTSSVMDKLGNFLLAGGRLLVLGRTHPLAAAPDREILSAAGLDRPLITATGTSMRVNGLNEAVQVQCSSRTVAGPYPGPRGAGGERAGESRWIPLVEVGGAGKNVACWPGSLWMTPQAHGRYGLAGWLGFNAAKDDARNLLPLITEVLSAMTRDVYIQRFGVPHHAMAAHASQMAHIRLVDRRMADVTPLRVAVEWINERGQEVRRHITPPIDALTSQAGINIGLAPSSSGGTERYTLRFTVRDRNDQRTIDRAEQGVTVFPADQSGPVGDSITVNASQLMQGRRPVFMLGVNYWPRLYVPLMNSRQHWLHPAWFDAEVVLSDLDLMASVGLNAIAFEYTDIEQAPQVRFVLHELRQRSMWALIYVPALNPLDLRLDEAKAMLKAIELERWPEVFALEVARGFPVLPRVESRRLDGEWRSWLEENFNSIDEAELKLGVSLWRERGAVAGPPDVEVRRGPDQNRAVALYYCFLRDFVSRRLGYIQRWKKSEGYQALVTARSAYGWSRERPPDILDELDISTGAHHLDLLFPDAWSIHPLRAMANDGDVLAAYVRGVGGGKPVVWSSFGQPGGGTPAPVIEQRQKEVYANYLGMFIKQEASGAFAWWYPPGTSGLVQEDLGLVHASGIWRPVEESLRSARLQIRQLRMQPRPVVRQPGPSMLAVSQWTRMQKDRQGIFSGNPASAAVTEWSLPGVGMDSRALIDPRYRAKWTETDAYALLNAEWTDIIIGDAMLDRQPGDRVRTYTGRPMRSQILNSGTIKWLGSQDRTNGIVSIRASSQNQQDEWISITDLDRNGRYTITWMPREPGVWELQPYMMGYGKFGERLQVEVSSPPRLF